jgi:hypothetical protein
MSKKIVKVNDRFQKNYRYYLTEPMGRNFYPEFKPELTPKQMLELGVFGGAYFNGKPSEFPKEWFKKAKLSTEKDPKINYFKVNASQPWKVWKKKGWLYKDDPRGWFQWYCRYYMGRRCPDDERQIKRWKAIKRHIAAIKKNCRKRDLNCRIKQRQAVLHWAYDSRKV